MLRVRPVRVRSCLGLGRRRWETGREMGEKETGRQEGGKRDTLETRSWVRERAAGRGETAYYVT